MQMVLIIAFAILGVLGSIRLPSGVKMHYPISLPELL